MKCPKCGKIISFQKKRCDGCNADITVYRRLYNLSNQYYNDGLSKAKVRDLSGAIVSLKNSLQFNRNNTDARNLLGLIYNEIGETVLALTEWVLSKNYQEDENEADYYMNLLQDNPPKLHNANQIIKKYNYALSQAKGGNCDLAILQLKKVVSAQPKYLAAHQLLALLYMNQAENEKAVKCLRKAQKIDISNTITLRYLTELGVNPNAVKIEREATKRVQGKGRALEKAEDPQFFAPEPVLRDGKINKWSFLHLLIGVVIGFLAVVFLVLPTRESAIADKYNKEAVDMAEEQTNMSSQMQTLENEKKQLEQKNKDLEAQLKKVKEEAVDEAAYNNFLKAVTLYIGGEKDVAAEKLIKINISKFDSKAAKELYNMIKEETFTNMSKLKYKEGYAAYAKGRYDEAITALKLALKYSSDNVDAMYYLGRTYQRTGDNTNARKYYKQIINNYSGNSSLSAQAERRLAELPEE